MTIHPGAQPQSNPSEIPVHIAAPVRTKTGFISAIGVGALGSVLIFVLGFSHLNAYFRRFGIHLSEIGFQPTEAIATSVRILDGLFQSLWQSVIGIATNAVVQNTFAGCMIALFLTLVFSPLRLPKSALIEAFRWLSWVSRWSPVQIALVLLLLVSAIELGRSSGVELACTHYAHAATRQSVFILPTTAAETTVVTGGTGPLAADADLFAIQQGSMMHDRLLYSSASTHFILRTFPGSGQSQIMRLPISPDRALVTLMPGLEARNANAPASDNC